MPDGAGDASRLAVDLDRPTSFQPCYNLLLDGIDEHCLEAARALLENRHQAGVEQWAYTGDSVVADSLFQQLVREIGNTGRIQLAPNAQNGEEQARDQEKDGNGNTRYGQRSR